MKIFKAIDRFFSFNFPMDVIAEIQITPERLGKLMKVGQACFCTYWGIETKDEDDDENKEYNTKFNRTVNQFHALDMAILSGLKLKQSYNRHEADIIHFALALKFFYHSSR